MLPSVIRADVLGKRQRADAPICQTKELVGRSRHERLLDRIYNRQGQKLRQLEAVKRQKLALYHKRLHAIRTREQGSTSSLKRAKKEENRSPTYVKVEETNDSQSDSKKTTRSDVASIVTILIKSTSSKKKLDKTIQLALQLTECQIDALTLRELLEFAAALACNTKTNTTELSLETRRNIIFFMKRIWSEIASYNSDKSNLDTGIGSLTNMNESSLVDCESLDSDSLIEYMNNSMDFYSWAHIISVSTLWHSMLLTDDMYEFNQALNQISAITKHLLPLNPACAQSLWDKSASESLYEKLLLFRANRNNNPTHRADCSDSYTNDDSSPRSLDRNLIEESDSSLFFSKTKISTEKNKSQSISEVLVDLNVFLPTRQDSFALLRESIESTLYTIFCYGQVKWARSAVLQFFQYLYINRHKMFSYSESNKVEQYQTSLLNNATKSSKPLVTCQQIGQSINPVKDGREEKVIAVHGASVWSRKHLDL